MSDTVYLIDDTSASNLLGYSAQDRQERQQGTTRLAVTLIRMDGGTQPRTETNWIVVADYAEAMQAGAQFPPVVAYFDDTDYWLADGFHRVLAAKQAGLEDIAADVRQGTRRDAILYAVGTNSSHGLRRTNADKRRAVETLLRDEEWALWSDSEIARQCAVNQSTVSRARHDMDADPTYAMHKSPIRHGADGRTINTAHIGKHAAPPTTAPIAQPVLQIIRDTAAADNPATVAALARVEPELQPAIASALAAGTTTSVQRLVKESHREAQREANRELVSHAPAVQSVATARYSTIVLDPPWDYREEGDNDAFGRTRPAYATMSIEEIQALPVGDLATDNAHVYLWITNRSLAKGFSLLESWGFRYITMLTWCKTSIGVGNYFRNNTEHVLFGVRGSLPLLDNATGTWFPAKRPGPHSAKPDEFYTLVEKCSPGPWLELFSRRERNGWTAWGELSA